MIVELPIKIESALHLELSNVIWDALSKWSPFTIAVDGVCGAGKSTLARYLAWKLGMSIVETDMFLIDEPGSLDHRNLEMLNAIQSRLKSNRPVIVEGIFVLHTLASLKICPDFIVLVEQEGHDAKNTSFEQQFY